eukprot:TRINITY_DN2613_c0_g1_i1.p1 TRINITY_DN2613_c0_g1~~TRINITY_DN2613_c0_g1_i1.p1  ORF type:complete len:161 (-),score=23.08 TRINITY_DN2613_c0_g1_i1:476-958(-)
MMVTFLQKQLIIRFLSFSSSNLELRDLKEIAPDIYRARNNKVVVTVLCRKETDNHLLEASILSTIPPNKHVAALMGVLTEFTHDSEFVRPALIVTRLDQNFWEMAFKEGHSGRQISGKCDSIQFDDGKRCCTCTQEPNCAQKCHTFFFSSQSNKGSSCFV